MDQQRQAYGGRLFDVLGDAFAEKPLRDLLMEAIRYGDDPARFAEIERVVDAQVADGCEELVRDRALARETLNPMEIDRLRQQMDEAMARRLQPHYIEAFFSGAFGRLGGRLIRREEHRFQINNVPALLRRRAVRREHGGRPVVRSYERVTFDPQATTGARDARRADLLTPGHPLFDAVLDTTIERSAGILDVGTVLYEPLNPAHDPYVLMAMTGEVVNGHHAVVSKRFRFVALHADGSITDAGPAPHLDLAPLPPEADAARDLALNQPWIAGGLTTRAMGWAASIAQPEHLAEVRAQLLPTIEKTTAAVRSRLIEQVNYLDAEAARLRESTDAGRPGGRRSRQTPERLAARARELESRLAFRTRELAIDAILTAKPPALTAVMLVVPAGMVGGRTSDIARDTTVTERRAVDAVLAAEVALGRTPEEMPHNHKGYDIRSSPPIDGSGARKPTVFIEVKGRIEGGQQFSISCNEVLHARNTGRQHRLALVSVSERGPEFDQIRYLTDYFRDYDMGTTDTASVMVDWAKAWSRGMPPH